MDSNPPSTECQDSSASSLEEQNPLVIVNPSPETVLPSPFAAASLSFSVPSTVIPNFSLHPKISTLFSPQPNKVKLLTQASSTVLNLSLSASTAAAPSPTKHSFNSTFSANPLQIPHFLGPHRPLDPSNGAAMRRASIVWFRNDLRVHDNECLNNANNESVSVLPVYCFDPRDFGKSSSGFDKTGPYRTKFIIESVSNLRENLQARGSDLVVRVGKPETVLVELAKAIGADAIYAHRDVSHDDVKAEDAIEAAMKEENVEAKYFWGSTLYHIDDLPFKLEEMPSNHSGFKEKVQKVDIRKTIEALDQMKGLPSRGGVEPGDIPTLTDLGFSPSATMTKDGKPAAGASINGGETEAIERLQKFIAECQAQPQKGSKDSSHDGMYGASFSCKISPWLTMGCLSPRFMFDELKNTVSRTDGDSGSSSNGTNWLMYELLWRDFFRFITKKYSSAKQQLQAAVPATGCTSAAIA